MRPPGLAPNATTAARRESGPRGRFVVIDYDRPATERFGPSLRPVTVMGVSVALDSDAIPPVRVDRASFGRSSER